MFCACYCPDFADYCKHIRETSTTPNTEKQLSDVDVVTAFNWRINASFSSSSK